MSTTLSELKQWFQNGVKHKALYMIVACDTFDWEDYPIYCKTREEMIQQVADHTGINMQKIMEVYDLTIPMKDQMIPGKLVRKDRE